MSQARLSDLAFTFLFHALEEEVATHSSILAWRIPGTENPRDRSLVAAVYGVTQSWTRLKQLSSSSSRLPQRRRQWHPTPALLPGKSHGQRSLVGCWQWGRLNTTERLHFHFYALEKEMATHSSVLAWRIPGTEEPGGLYGVTQSQTRLK